MPTRSITKALEPRLATLSATYKFNPLRIDITATRVVTASITPSRVRKVRSLCDRSVSSAIQKVSCNATSDCLNSDRGFRGLPSTLYNRRLRPQKISLFRPNRHLKACLVTDFVAENPLQWTCERFQTFGFL